MKRIAYASLMALLMGTALGEVAIKPPKFKRSDMPLEKTDQPPAPGMEAVAAQYGVMNDGHAYLAGEIKKWESDSRDILARAAELAQDTKGKPDGVINGLVDMYNALQGENGMYDQVIVLYQGDGANRGLKQLVNRYFALTRETPAKNPEHMKLLFERWNIYQARALDMVQTMTDLTALLKTANDYAAQSKSGLMSSQSSAVKTFNGQVVQFQDRMKKFYTNQQGRDADLKMLEKKIADAGIEKLTTMLKEQGLR